MIQDIFPKVYNNEFKNAKPEGNSVILFFKNQNILVKHNQDKIEFPRYKDISSTELTFTYLFRIDEINYFIGDTEEDIIIDRYSYENINILRSVVPKYSGFAGITAYHLYCWYKDNKYCGRCGNKVLPHHKERMLFCDKCKNSIYPKISPAIIVAVTDGDKLLMSKYAGRDYTNYALIAGFSEIGESVEKTVEREIMEEVGLKVKNITYYKSQPWAFSSSLLIGYFAELDGDSTITIDEEELAEAKWFTREEIQIEDDGISLTREMIHKFKTKA